MTLAFAATLCALTACGCLANESLNEFADGRGVRVVWVKDLSDSGDVFARGSGLLLMGLDSRDGRGPRAIFQTQGSYFKPLLTSDGRRVVYTDLAANQIYVVDFGSGPATAISSGVALDTWSDPADGTQWVFVRAKADDPVSPVAMVRLDDPRVRRKIWSASPVETDNFQVSADGAVAGGQFPWPEAGLAMLDEQFIQKRGQGCWTSLAPDNSYMLWRLDGAHRNVRLFAGMSDTIGKTVSFNDSPDLSDREIYHPRWSNDVRFVAITGPYDPREDPAAGLVGGVGVEIYIGKFDENFRRVSWLRLTNDKHGDYYPDVWVAPAASAPSSAKIMPASASTSAPAQVVKLQARLVKLTDCPEPRAILPYKNALVADLWKVERVIEGKPISGDILVASWRIVGGEKLAPRWSQGQSYLLTVCPYDSDGSLSGQRLIMDYENATLPLYYDPTFSPLPAGGRETDSKEK